MAHVDLGRGILEKIRSDLDEVSKTERDPKLEGRRMIMILAPKS